MSSEMKTASDMRRPAKNEEKKRPASIGSPLPEAFIKAHEGPKVACGELAFEVWEGFGLPPKERK